MVGNRQQLRFVCKYLRYVPSLRKNGFRFITSLLQYSATDLESCLSDLVTTLAFELRNNPIAYKAWHEQHELWLQEVDKKIDSRKFVAPAVLIFLDFKQSKAIENLTVTINSLKRQSVCVDHLSIQLINIHSNADLKQVRECLRGTRFDECSVFEEPGAWWAFLPTVNDVLFTTVGTKFHPSAMTFFSEALTTKPGLVYCDHGEVHNESRQLISIRFKPDFSAELLRCNDYIGRTFVCSKNLLQALGRHHAPTHYDIKLAAIVQSEKVTHLAKVLHTGFELPPDFDVSDSIKRNIQRTIDIDSLGLNFELLPIKNTKKFITRYRNSGSKQIVTIIIPTKDRIELLSKCIESIHKASVTVPYEILIVDNQSSEAQTARWLEVIQEQYDHVRVMQANYQFNWAKLNNDAIGRTEGDVLVLLNNDIEIIAPDWLDQICGQLTRKEVGIVGGLLKYPNGTIQHAGTITGPFGKADHIFRSLKPEDIPPTCIVNPYYQREVTAVTGAFMAITRSNLDSIGPFNEKFRVCGSDIEYCLRMRQASLITLFDPSLEMIHHESMTRDPMPPEDDIQLLLAKIREFDVEEDPFYNKNLSKFSSYPLPDII